MARVTVEDCVVQVPNRFDLVMLAAQRARNISAGAELTLERDKDKNPVVALREIAEETVELANLESSLIKALQKHVEMDEPEEDEMDLDAIQQETGEAAVDPETAIDPLNGDEDAKLDAEFPPEADETAGEVPPEVPPEVTPEVPPEVPPEDQPENQEEGGGENKAE